MRFHPNKQPNLTAYTRGLKYPSLRLGEESQAPRVKWQLIPDDVIWWALMFAYVGMLVSAAVLKVYNVGFKLAQRLHEAHPSAAHALVPCASALPA